MYPTGIFPTTAEIGSSNGSAFTSRPQGQGASPSLTQTSQQMARRALLTFAQRQELNENFLTNVSFYASRLSELADSNHSNQGLPRPGSFPDSRSSSRVSNSDDSSRSSSRVSNSDDSSRSSSRQEDNN